jgi:5'-methylthioadenosine phosphorylase
MARTTVGVIGGTGLYELAALRNVEEVVLETPFGAPSDAFICGDLEDVRMVFLPRHARGHKLLPTEVPYRANIWGMKKLGAEWVVSLSAVGSLREEHAPGEFVIVDQFIDRTRHRNTESTFFGGGVVTHVSFGDPVSAPLGDVLQQAAEDEGIVVHRGGTYVCMEGPAFSTRAESHLYRQIGGSVIGMTNIPEAKLAREAELPYATVALVTDYDSWRESEDAVGTEEILATLAANADAARRLVARAAPRVPTEPDTAATNALDGALITPLDAIPPERMEQLDLFLRRYLP